MSNVVSQVYFQVVEQCQGDKAQKADLIEMHNVLKSLSAPRLFPARSYQG
jgi:hypothetical protein